MHVHEISTAKLDLKSLMVLLVITLQGVVSSYVALDYMPNKKVCRTQSEGGQGEGGRKRVGAKGRGE